MLLQTLSNRAGVSGNEGPIRKLLIPAVKDYVDELTVDTMGNVYAVKHGTGDSPLTVMVTAHMDEVGFMITKITAGGLLKFETVGAIDPRILPGQTVRVGPKKLPGVIGAKALHNLSDAERTAAPTAGGLAIDIGAAGKEAAEA
ncbi:MAG: M42 family peptidase, partial [Anaerolineae bacterium]